MALYLGIAAVASAALAALVWLLLLRNAADTVGVRLLGRDLELLRPRWLLLCAIVPYLWLVGAHSLTDLSRAQRVLSAAVRSLVVVGLALALARPALTRYDTRTVTVYLVDVSDSVGDGQLAAARGQVERAVRERGEHVVRLITFARRPRVVDIPERGPVPPLARHAGAGDATDLAAAVRLAYGLFDEDRLRRIVVLSDGAETDGDLVAEAGAAARSRVRVFYRSFPAEATREVAVASLEVPDKVTIGQPFTVRAEVFSSHATTATLGLAQDGAPNGLEPRKALALAPGRNVVPFRSVVRNPGFVTYKVTASGMAEDSFKDNNHALATLSVRGKPRVLYVEGEHSSAHYLARALESQSIDVEVRGPHGLPGSARELDRYDLVVMSDVPQTFVS
ncbi:MAG: VWA domain-containing protein, partial [Deltaproteobacteria bacterium]|nr:VWA domain-containing protein [Deltaproteobacteria bacterium]